MRKKTKGFTILELIITLSLTVVVLGVVYTFFFSNSKTLTTTEINSDLQLESETIQKELLLYGTQAEGISKILDNDSNNCIDKDYNSLRTLNGKLEVTELNFKIGLEYFTFLYDSENKTLILKKVTDAGVDITDSTLNFPKVLSENVTTFEVRPLDLNMNSSGTFKTATGLEISLILNKKKGYSDVTMPVSVIVKLRNKS